MKIKINEEQKHEATVSKLKPNRLVLIFLSLLKDCNARVNNKNGFF